MLFPVNLANSQNKRETNPDSMFHLMGELFEHWGYREELDLVSVPWASEGLRHNKPVAPGNEDLSEHWFPYM